MADNLIPLKLVSFKIKFCFIHYNNRIRQVILNKIFAHPRYFLEGRRPSETGIFANFVKCHSVRPYASVNHNTSLNFYFTK